MSAYIFLLESVLKVIYLREDRPLTVRRVYLDHVKARLKLRPVRDEPIFGGQDHTPLLCRGHKFARFGKFRVPAQLHLNKGNDAAAQRDDVYLSRAAAEVALKDSIPFAAQLFRRALLAPRTKLPPLHQCIFLRKLGRCSGDGPYSLSAS